MALDVQTLERSTKYRIRTIIGEQKNEREHVMVFLGVNEDGSTSWSARPAAGTQNLANHQIRSLWSVDPNAACYVNRVIHEGRRLY